MVTDPIADMLTSIKNGYMAKKAAVVLPHSKLKESLAKVLVSAGFLADSQAEDKDGKKSLVLKLKYHQKQPAITDLRRISKPSLRIYMKSTHLPRVLGGLGLAVISTPAGLMTDGEARKKKLGGEVICEIW